jgi:hypothetical protein
MYFWFIFMFIVNTLLSPNFCTFPQEYGFSWWPFTPFG